MDFSPSVSFAPAKIDNRLGLRIIAAKAVNAEALNVQAALSDRDLPRPRQRGYLVKRTHSLMVDAMEPVFEARGFTFLQYVILAWLRDGIAVNPRDTLMQFRHDSGCASPG